MERGSSHPTPLIVEAYRHYDPPCDVKRIIALLLRHVPSENLLGLGSIVLTNSSALPRDGRRQKTWSRGRKVRIVDALGLYYRATHRSEANIRIFVDNILRRYPKRLFWIRPLLNLQFSNVLYHEIGRHIHATRRPEFREKEDVADKWKAKLNRNFLSRRYWYLFPVALVLKLIIDLGGDLRLLVRRFRRVTAA